MPPRTRAHGAAAISVLTDGPFFGGSLDDLRAVVAQVSVPVLRRISSSTSCKSSRPEPRARRQYFLSSACSRPCGSRSSSRCAEEWRLDALVEIHTDAELAIALEAGAASSESTVGISIPSPSTRRGPGKIASSGTRGSRRGCGERHGDAVGCGVGGHGWCGCRSHRDGPVGRSRSRDRPGGTTGPTACPSRLKSVD